VLRFQLTGFSIRASLKVSAYAPVAAEDSRQRKIQTAGHSYTPPAHFLVAHHLGKLKDSSGSMLRRPGSANTSDKSKHRIPATYILIAQQIATRAHSSSIGQSAGKWLGDVSF
jgi:hypothetical protein